MRVSDSPVKMNKPTIVYFGSSDFAVPALAALHRSGADIIYVVTRPDRVRARGGKTLPTPVKAYASKAGLKILEPENIRDNRVFHETLEKASPDLLVVASYGKILPRETLDVAARGAVNIHASLLPEYRGAAPIQRAIMDGCDVTGVSLMRMSEGLDDGDVIQTARIPIGNSDAGALTESLAVMGADLLMEYLPRLIDGTATYAAQDETKATYAAKIEKSDARIDFTKGSEEIERLVRAMSPMPGAYAKRGEERIGIARARTHDGDGMPGQVVSVSKDGIFVGTGRGLLVIEEVKMPGKRVMPVADYLRGNAFSTEPPFD